MRSSGLRGRFVGAREAASSVHALVCPPQAPLRADPLLSCGPRNRQRTAAGQRAGSAPEQGMWLAGATSFRRALGSWDPGGKSPPQAPKSPPQAPLSEIRRAERPSPLTKWPQIRLHARHGRGIEDPEVTALRRGDGRSPGERKMRLPPLLAIRLPVEAVKLTAIPGRGHPQGRRQTPGRSR